MQSGEVISESEFRLQLIKMIQDGFTLESILTKIQAWLYCTTHNGDFDSMDALCESLSECL